MALTNPCFKDQVGLMFWGEEEPYGRREEEDEGAKIKQAKKVWKLTLIMNPMRFGMDLWLCRIIIFPKLGVLLGLHLNPKIMESKVGEKPHMAQDSYGILPLRKDSWGNCE